MSKLIEKLALGCARFGHRPGLAPDETDAPAEAALALALEAGLTLADTSAQWGESEKILGRALPPDAPLQIMTKTITLAVGVEAVERRARASLDHLGRSRAHALIVQDAADLLSGNGPALWLRLQRLKAEGLFSAIGISARTEDDPLGLVQRFAPDLIQVPASLADPGLITDGVLAEIAALGVEIHLRSVLMQGLMFTPAHKLPLTAAPFAPALSHARRMIAEAGVDPLQAALGFALGRPEASRVIVGVSSAHQLRAILAAAARPAPALDWTTLVRGMPRLYSQRRDAAA